MHSFTAETGYAAALALGGEGIRSRRRSRLVPRATPLSGRIEEIALADKVRLTSMAKAAG